MQKLILTILLACILASVTLAQQKREAFQVVSSIAIELQREYKDCEESSDCRAWKRGLSRILHLEEQRRAGRLPLDDLDRFINPGTIEYTNKYGLRLLTRKIETKGRRERLTALLDELGVPKIPESDN
jgi:hypothetical protein